MLGGSWLLEQLFGGRAMSLDAVDMRLDAGDLRLQAFDALMELVDRQWIKVLLGKRNQGIVGLAWKQLFQIHGWSR